MLRKCLIVSGLVFLLVSGAAALDAEVQKSCPADEEALVSLNFTDGGHLAEPGYYPHNVCVDGANGLEIKNSCGEDQNFLFSMFSRKNSHFSIFKTTYTYSVCSEALRGYFIDSKSCMNGTKAFSLYSSSNSHAAAPGYSDQYFDKSFCLSYERPENVTLTLNGVTETVYADGEKLSDGESILPPVELPYVATDQPKGIVGLESFYKASHNRNKISLTQEFGGSFLIPFTDGGYREIEDEQNVIVNENFLDQVDPSFHYAVHGEPLVRVIYRDHDYNLTSDRLWERADIIVRHEGLSSVLKPEIGLNTD
ncbi:MAG: hypothetical protein ABEJ83_04480 [Candidatus Nanohaloarchaea archaeon]